MGKGIIYDDLYRYEGKRTFGIFLRYFFFTPAFRYIYYFRRTQLASTLVTRLFWKVLLRRCMMRTGIQIPASCQIGPGFRIAHFGMMAVNPQATIGKNFNIHQGVSIGNAQGRRAGAPKIGDNVSIHANAVLVGGITIGDDVLIAPNAFVNFDVPKGALVLGNPGKIIPREKASAEYLVYTI